MTIRVVYQLSKLSDRAINALLSGCEAGSGVKTTLVENMGDVLTAELRARAAGHVLVSPQSFEIEVGFGAGDHRAITEAFDNCGDAVLFFEIQARSTGGPEREDFENCADFLKATAVAIRHLLVKYDVA